MCTQAAESYLVISVRNWPSRLLPPRDREHSLVAAEVLGGECVAPASDPIRPSDDVALVEPAATTFSVRAGLCIMSALEDKRDGGHAHIP
jgi:hypothetical protein